MAGKIVNVGVAGLGFMGATHLKAYLKIPGARIAAVCDSGRTPFTGDLSRVGGNIGGGTPLQLDMNGVQVYGNFTDLLADPKIDLIDICTPTPMHHAFCLEALRSGKHVLCEKPLARTSALAQDIVQAAAGAKGFFMPAMVMRFWPHWAWLKNAVTQKTYGKVLAARFRRVASPPGWSKGHYLNGANSGGALLDFHIHDTDFVQFCFGQPNAVFSIGTIGRSGAIDHVSTSYMVGEQISVTAEASWLMAESFGFKMEFTVNFERATADFDIGRGPDALKLFLENQPGQTVDCGCSDGYEAELRYMIDCIQRGQRPTMVTAADGYNAVRICEAEEQSIQSGSLIRLS